MNLLDLIVLAIIAYGAFVGLRKGLVRILFDLIALVAGIALALAYFEEGAIFLGQTLNLSGTIATFISFIAIWGIIWASISAVGRLINNGASFSILWPINRLGGALLGGIRSFLYILPILIPIAHSELDLYHSSQLAKPINNFVSERIINSNKASTLINALNKKNKPATDTKKKELLDDPNLQKLQSALGSENKEDLHEILQNLDNQQ